VLRIKQQFHTLSTGERKRWLDAVVALNPARGEAVAIEIIERSR